MRFLCKNIFVSVLIPFTGAGKKIISLTHLSSLSGSDYSDIMTGNSGTGEVDYVFQFHPLKNIPLVAFYFIGTVAEADRAVFPARSCQWLVDVSKAGDEEINGSYDFVTMFLEGTYFIPKAIYRNSGQFSR
jgi:hypothetical protein